MEQITFSTTYKKILADTLTPVGIYLRIRDIYPNSILMESSDYHGNEHSYSLIGCEPIAKFEIKEKNLQIDYPNGEKISKQLDQKSDVIGELTAFANSFAYDKQGFDFITNGLFGYSSFDAVQYFEDVEIKSFDDDSRRISEMVYQVYKTVIVFNHFNNEVFVFEHLLPGFESTLEQTLVAIQRKNFATYSFESANDETSNYSDEEFLKIIQKGKEHCFRGDVFQIVLSRRFSQHFKGDEFNVYRSLRSINPSPYLFYFDYGTFKIFGSSPEAQIVIKEGKATIYPIAGTFKRTGNDKQDFHLAKELFDDPKENSEHIMLVDLARNDLSRHGNEVHVATFKEIQYYSHVIHMVSKVVCNLDGTSSPLQLVADTFPAGTLSGAPKHNAITLINRYENSNRGYYGGAIGHIGFNGEFNHAIMIRSILSKGNTLFYQAGAGVVAKSDIQSELNEVENKLMALKKAIKNANDI